QGLAGQAASERLWRERTGIRDQGSRRVHLAPRVPEQHAAHATLLEVVDHPLPERLLPLGDRLKAGVYIPDGFITQLKEVGVEEGEMVIGRWPARHVQTSLVAHRVCVVFMLHPDVFPKSRVEEVHYVPEIGRPSCRESG